MTRSNLAHKSIEVRKPWRSNRRQPTTFFDSYHARLHALAHRHGVPPAHLKALIEDAFGKCDCPPAEQEAKIAMCRLMKLKVRVSELNWLFQCHVLTEQEIS